MSSIEIKISHAIDGDSTHTFENKEHAMRFLHREMNDMLTSRIEEHEPHSIMWNECVWIKALLTEDKTNIAINCFNRTVGHTVSLSEV